MAPTPPTSRRTTISGANSAGTDSVRVEVGGLSKSFGPVQAVSDLHFTVEPGLLRAWQGALLLLGYGLLAAFLGTVLAVRRDVV
jgi:hypothetical protein